MITKTSEGPIGIGSTYETQEAGPFGKTLREKVEVIGYRTGELFAWRSYGPVGTWFDWSFEVRPQDTGTILIERLDRSKGLLAEILLKLIFQRQMRRSIPEGLGKIKGRAEGD